MELLLFFYHLLSRGQQVMNFCLLNPNEPICFLAHFENVQLKFCPFSSVLEIQKNTANQEALFDHQQIY
jgi:hypothetical protein